MNKSFSFDSNPSLLDFVKVWNNYNDPLPLSSSHTYFLDELPASIPQLSAFEFHLDPNNSLCDTLLCIPIARLQSLKSCLSKAVSIDSATLSFISKTISQIQELNHRTSLLCLIDHIWLELDSPPANTFSLFLGPENYIQPKEERDLFFDQCLDFFLSTEEELTLFELQKSYLRYYFDLLIDIIPEWQLSEIGIMRQSSEGQHLKMLFSPPTSLSLAELLELLLKSTFPGSQILGLVDQNVILSQLTKFPHTCKLSFSNYRTQCQMAIEVKPEFQPNMLETFEEFWKLFFELIQPLGFSGSHLRQPTHIRINSGMWLLESRLHHFKIFESRDGSLSFKFYRDWRISRNL